MARRVPEGYRIETLYLVHCRRCNEEISRAQNGEDYHTRAEADQAIADHQAMHERDDEL